MLIYLYDRNILTEATADKVEWMLAKVEIESQVATRIELHLLFQPKIIGGGAREVPEYS